MFLQTVSVCRMDGWKKSKKMKARKHSVRFTVLSSSVCIQQIKSPSSFNILIVLCLLPFSVVVYEELFVRETEIKSFGARTRLGARWLSG